MTLSLKYSTLSINDKEWKEIHPEHLKLILIGFFIIRKWKFIKRNYDRNI